MRTILIVALFFLGYHVNSQIYIGQKSEEVLFFVNQASQLKGWYIDKKFKNGKLSEIIIYKPKQVYYDLDISTESIEYIFINEKNNFAYSLSQFPQLSLKYITEKFEKYYSNHKINGHYFTEDYLHFRKLSITDGYPTILYKKTHIESLPTLMKKEVEKRMRDSEQKKIEREEEREEIAHLENDYFDIAEYDTVYVDKIYPQIETIAINHLFDDLEIEDGEQKQIREHFKIKLKALKNIKHLQSRSATIKNEGRTPYEFYPKSLFSLNIQIPFIKEEYKGVEYNLNRFLEVNLTYDLIAGLVNVKKKKSGIQVLNAPNLSIEYKTAIENLLKNEANGIYTIKYQFGLVNNTDAKRIVATKIK